MAIPCSQTKLQKKMQKNHIGRKKKNKKIRRTNIRTQKAQ